MLIEPLNSLDESLLLGKLLGLAGEIGSYSKSVLNVRVQVDLEGLAGLDEDLLGAVSQVGGEDAVGLSGSDGERTLDGLELLLLDERGVSDVADLDTGLVVADNVLRLLVKLLPLTKYRTYLGAEAVSNRSNLGKTLVLEVLDSLDNNGVDLSGSMGVVAVATLCDPAHDIDIDRGVGHDIAVEDVGDNSGVAIGGELVGHELAVVPDTKDIGDVDNASALVSLALGSSRKVGSDTAGKLDHLASGLASAGIPCQSISALGGSTRDSGLRECLLVAHTLCAALCGLVRSHCV